MDLRFAPAMIEGASARGAGVRQRVERIDIEGFCSSVSSGDPALPCKLIYVALPPDADESTVSLSSSGCDTALLPGTYDVAPVPAITSTDFQDFGPAKSVSQGRNSLVYARNAFYPAKHLRVVEVGHLRSWKVAVVEFWPYAYNPTTGKLRVVASERANLTFRRKSVPPPPPDRLAATMSGFVQNQSEAEAWYGAASSVKPGYAIITTNAIASASTALAEFVNFQSARGFAVKVVTESGWGGGNGSTAAGNIRAWLQLNYQSQAIQYVLLIGGSDPTSGTVPMKMLWPRNWASSYKEAPSDYYYADLTGNWDRDGDGYAGEEPDDFGAGGIDRIPEVYVGRIPYYGSIAELDSILRKTVVYESLAPGPWAKSFLLPMVALDTDTPSYQLGEQIAAAFARPKGLTVDRMYDAGCAVSPPPEHSPSTYDAVQNDWTKGAGLVFWMTHGSQDTATSVFASARCLYLDDSRPAIVYMASCLNGKPEDAANLGYRALAHGSVATLSASRVSWYYLAQTDFSRTDSIGGMGYQYARFLLQSGEPCGKALADARLANPMGIWPNHLVFNLYGDPSLAYILPKPATALTRVADAQNALEGSWVTLTSALLSRTDPVECFVQDADRCAGIRVYYESGAVQSLAPGTVVSVTGRLVSEGGMRVLENADISPAGGTATLAPLGVSNADCSDPKTFGLLVKVWGKVLSSSASSFAISDGSRGAGLIIACRNMVTPPPVGSFARVVGVCTPDDVSVYRAADLTY